MTNTSRLLSPPPPHTHHTQSPSVLNIFIKHTGSTGAVPAGIYFTIVAIWFLVSIPLTFVGGYVATKVRPCAVFPCMHACASAPGCQLASL